jgi:hypothetical protein
MSRLGKYQREFVSSAERGDLLIAVGFLLGGLGGAVYWLVACGPLTDAGSFFTLLFSLLSAGFGGYLTWHDVDSRLGGVELYSGGLKVRRAWRAAAIAWEDIAAVTGAIPVRHNGAPAHVGGLCRLGLTDGRAVDVPLTVQDFSALADRVQEEVLARQLPAAEAALRAGERLTFGAVAIDSEGLRVGEQALPWAEFTGFSFPWHDVGVAANMVCLHANDPVEPWAAVPAKDVPNAHLLVTLARSWADDPGVLPFASPNLALPPAPGPSAPPAPVLALGTVVPSRHTATWRSLAGMGDSSVAMMGLGGVFTTLLTPALLFGWAKSPTDAAILGVLLLATVGLFLAGLALGLWRPRLVEVSGDGLAWTRLGRLTRRGWDECREVYSSDLRYESAPGVAGASGAHLADLRVVFTDGRAVSFQPWLSNYDKLLFSVKRAVTAVQLPAARRELSAGTVRFGHIELSTKGIAFARQVTPWEEVEKVWVGKGFVGWRSRRGRAWEHPLAEVPNPELLLTLIREKVGERCETAGLA